MLGGDGVFRKGPSGCDHLVEGGHAVAGFEFENGRADTLDDAGYVVARVCSILLPNGLGVMGDYFPVFGVGARGVDFYEDLVRGGELGNGGVEDVDFYVWIIYIFGQFWG